MATWSEKGFIDVVRKLHQYILDHALQPGDKLPSERVLSDSLQVGRSTVREAFRSLELLGIIETKRGEGTFLCEATNHQLIEILGMFILSVQKSRDDVNDTKFLLEQMVLRSVFASRDEQTWPDFIGHLEEMLCAQKYETDAYAFMLREFFLLKNNRFLLKIWLLISEYHRSVLEESKTPMTEEKAKQWAQKLLIGNIEGITI